MVYLDVTHIATPEILLWLLTYAIVYGVLQQVNIPQSKAARTIIAIVSAFLVLMSYPQEIILVLSKMASSMILVILALLILVVIIESVGLEDSAKPYKHNLMSKVLMAFLVLVVVMIFIHSGGLRLLGISTGGGVGNIDWNSLLFIILVIGAIWWLSSEGKSGG